MKDKTPNGNSEHWKRLLAQLDRLASELQGGQEISEELRREVEEVAQAFPGRRGTDGAHYDLETLRQMVETRRQQATQWEMPIHLARCPVCLELFEILLEGVPLPSRRALSRFVHVADDYREVSPKVLLLQGHLRTFLKMAAAIALLMGSVLLAQYWWRAGAMRVADGRVTLSTGKVLNRGASIPEGVVLHVKEPSAARLRDGSRVDIQAGTHLSFHKSTGGDTTVRLVDGGIVAAVAPQKEQQEFIVLTRLGEVAVLGTRFSVVCTGADGAMTTGAASAALGPETAPPTVRVAVFEGIVRVRSQQQTALVGPKRIAVLRDQEPRIELIPAKP